MARRCRRIECGVCKSKHRAGLWRLVYFELRHFQKCVQWISLVYHGHTGFVGVEDVARAAVMVMESDISGERFIVNNENWTFQQMLNTIADGFGKKRPHREATRLMGAIAWRLEKVKSLITGKRPLLTKHSAVVGHSKTHFDNSKILRQLPQFSFTPLQQSIEKACRQYVSQPPPSGN